MVLEAVGRFLVAAQRERQIAINPDAPAEEVLEKLELLRDGRLTHAAVLLFGRAPQRFLRQSEVHVSRFKGTQPLQFLDMKVIEGSLLAQRDLIMEFIQRHISMAAEIKGLAREEPG